MPGPRIPPHDESVETSILGGILIDKDAIVEVAEFLRPEHFYKPIHAYIYEAMLNLYERREPIDLVTLAAELKKQKQLTKIGGSTYLTALTEEVPTAANIENYANLVKDLWIKRTLINKAGKLAEMGFDEGVEVKDLMDQAEQEIFALSQTHIARSFISMKKALEESFNRLDELHKTAGGLRGVPSGFTDLDEALAGMQPSNLLILAARPGIGKTSFAMNIARYVAVEHQLPVGYFSLEMSSEELVDRTLVRQSGIDAWKLKTGKLDEEDFGNLSDAMGILAEAPLFIDDTPGISILEMRTKARRLMAEHGLKLIVVDYLQLARPSRRSESRVQEVTEISMGLKNLARELKVPVLALSQLSRQVEHRGNKKPNLADLRESGCLLGDTLITIADTGQQIAIQDLVGKKNFKTLAMNLELKLVPATVSGVFPSGKKVVYQMTLKSGKQITASANHPFFKLSGWTRLDKLAKGDRIAVPRQITISTTAKTISDNRLILLAHLIGNGCYVKRQPLHYTNADKKLIDIVKKAATSEFKISAKIVPQKNWFHLYLASEQKLTHGKRNPIVKWLDEELQIYGQKSREKIIPDVVFQQLIEKIKIFLKHLWATDGCIFVNNRNAGPKVRIYYASGNQTLVKQVSHLLLRLGIISKISSTKKTGYQDMWSVHVQGNQDQLKFLKQIGCVGEKEDIVKKAIQTLQNIESNPNNDVIPNEIWQEIEQMRVDAGLSTREFHKQLGWAYSGTQRHKNGISRLRVKHINSIIKNPKLDLLANSDIYWDEIKEIKKLGIRQVYDATVPEHASFVANDIIVHNSIEQDADVVMFLWREDEEILEQVTLSIDKHRNGPLRTLKLFFKGNLISFFGVEKKQKTAAAA